MYLLEPGGDRSAAALGVGTVEYHQKEGEGRRGAWQKRDYIHSELVREEGPERVCTEVEREREKEGERET